MIYILVLFFVAIAMASVFAGYALAPMDREYLRKWPGRFFLFGMFFIFIFPLMFDFPSGNNNVFNAIGWFLLPASMSLKMFIGIQDSRIKRL